jgi:TonB family protein
MLLYRLQMRVKSLAAAGIGLVLFAAPALGLIAAAQQTPAAASGLPAPAATPPPGAAQTAKSSPAPAPEPDPGLTEDQLQKMLAGKPMFLRGGYLDSNLTFAEDGELISGSERGSYTLCGVEIKTVRLTKHKVELTGARYGLHFLGALPYEDPGKAVDRVNLTPNKNALKITIEREQVETPKAFKLWPGGKLPFTRSAPAARPAPPATKPAPAEDAAETANPPAGPSAGPHSGTAAPSPAHSAHLLEAALNRIFAPGIDSRLIAAMPGFWQLYYQAAAAKTDYRPSDPAVLRQNMVDRKARLLTNFVPLSNEYAQANAVAGMALYHVVIGADGKPGEIAVSRPIGFGLDENAVAAIRKASFEPALKDGKPVPVLLDLVVQFRIYSKRTAVVEKPASAAQPAAPQPSAPSLPGPYSVPRP